MPSVLMIYCIYAAAAAVWKLLSVPRRQHMRRKMITFAVISKVLVSKTSIDKYVLHANLHCCFLHLIMLNIMSALLFGQKNEKNGER